MMMPEPVLRLPYRALASGLQAPGSESDFHNFHPHLHVSATNGCFYNDAAIMVCPLPDTAKLAYGF